MTAENRALLDNFFSGYECRNDTREISIRSSFTKADSMKDLKHLRFSDERAAAIIGECRALVDQLTAYRISLTERYNYLSTAAAVPVVKLIRERNWYDKKVYYYLRTFRRYLDDGTDIEESCTKYHGSDRKKAFSDFDEYCRSHPGIIAEKEIEKRLWE